MVFNQSNSLELHTKMFTLLNGISFLLKLRNTFISRFIFGIVFENRKITKLKTLPNLQIVFAAAAACVFV